MRRFYMLRHEDVGGNSGTGIVAEGIIFDDGSGSFTWLTPIKTITNFFKIKDVKVLHSHEGRTEIIVEGKGKKFEECQRIVRAKKSEEKNRKKREIDE
jgi:hypothetical protein